MALLRLPKRYDPEFGVPRRKPTGPVEIDWSNPLTHGLMSCFVFDRGVLRDLTGRIGLTFVPGTVPIDQRVWGQDRFTGIETGTGSAARPHFILDTKLYEDIDEISFSFSTIKPSTRLYFLYEGGSRNTIEMSNTAGVIISNATGANRLQWEVTHTSSNTPSHYCFTRRPSASAPNYGTSSYRDGEDLTASQTMVYTTLGANPATAQTTGQLLDSTASTGQGFYGYLYVHSRELSQAEAISLSRDPYQILKPANDLYYFPSAAGGGAYTLNAESGSFTLGSDPVTFIYGPNIQADVGTYTLGSDAVNLLVGRHLDAAVGTYTLGGDAVNFSVDRRLAADVGSYTLGGDDVTLTYTPVDTLSADVGVYSLGSDAVNLLYNRRFVADPATYTLAITDVTLTVDTVQSADCFTWVVSNIEEALYLSGTISEQAEYLTSNIDDGATFLTSAIDDGALFLTGDLCSCP